MPRLYLFAEGQTEQSYADEVLRPHLAGHGVYLQGPILIANARKKGTVHRGGGRRYIPMRNDIIRFLKQESGRDVYFTTMIDLYALHAGFPGLEDAEKSRNSPYQRVAMLETSFAADIGDPRFLPHIQLHEFEAILFCQPAGFASFYAEGRRSVDRLAAVAAQFRSPELIDDGQHTAPSKRIIEIFPDYEDAKVTVGVEVAKGIGLEVVRSKCSHFNKWLERLEQLSGQAES